jgi:hypothetical protein
VSRLPSRSTDRVEDAVAWLLLVLGAAVVAGAVAVGLTVHDAALRRVDEAGARVAGAAWAAAVVVGGWTLLVLAWSAVRAVTGRRNDRAWDRDWERLARGSDRR